MPNLRPSFNQVSRRANIRCRVLPRSKPVGEVHWRGGEARLSSPGGGRRRLQPLELRRKHRWGGDGEGGCGDGARKVLQLGVDDWTEGVVFERDHSVSKDLTGWHGNQGRFSSPEKRGCNASIASTLLKKYISTVCRVFWGLV